MDRIKQIISKLVSKVNRQISDRADSSLQVYLASTFGTSQIAANGIGQTLWSLASSMCVSMNPVFITVIGQCMGAKDSVTAEWYLRKLVRWALIISALWNALVLAMLPTILPLYSITAETRRLVWIIVIIHNSFAAFVQPFAMPLSSGLRAAGDVRFTMWALIFTNVVCRTLLSFVFGLWMHMGVVGIALAMCMDWCIKAALDIWRFRRGTWKNFIGVASIGVVLGLLILINPFEAFRTFAIFAGIALAYTGIASLINELKA